MAKQPTASEQTRARQTGVDAAQLWREQREAELAEAKGARRCIACGQPGHGAATCPNTEPKAGQASVRVGGVGRVPLDQEGRCWFECPGCGAQLRLWVEPEPGPDEAEPDDGLHALAETLDAEEAKGEQPKR